MHSDVERRRRLAVSVRRPRELSVQLHDQRQHLYQQFRHRNADAFQHVRRPISEPAGLVGAHASAVAGADARSVAGADSGRRDERAVARADARAADVRSDAGADAADDCVLRFDKDAARVVHHKRDARLLPGDRAEQRSVRRRRLLPRGGVHEHYDRGPDSDLYESVSKRAVLLPDHAADARCDVCADAGAVACADACADARASDAGADAVCDVRLTVRVSGKRGAARHLRRPVGELLLRLQQHARLPVPAVGRQLLHSQSVGLSAALCGGGGRLRERRTGRTVHVQPANGLLLHRYGGHCAELRRMRGSDAAAAARLLRRAHVIHGPVLHHKLDVGLLRALFAVEFHRLAARLLPGAELRRTGDYQRLAVCRPVQLSDVGADARTDDVDARNVYVDGNFGDNCDVDIDNDDNAGADADRYNNVDNDVDDDAGADANGYNDVDNDVDNDASADADDVKNNNVDNDVDNDASADADDVKDDNLDDDVDNDAGADTDDVKDNNVDNKDDDVDNDAGADADNNKDACADANNVKDDNVDNNGNDKDDDVDNHCDNNAGADADNDKDAGADADDDQNDVDDVNDARANARADAGADAAGSALSARQ